MARGPDRGSDECCHGGHCRSDHECQHDRPSERLDGRPRFDFHSHGLQRESRSDHSQLHQHHLHAGGHGRRRWDQTLPRRIRYRGIEPADLHSGYEICESILNYNRVLPHSRNEHHRAARRLHHPCLWRHRLHAVRHVSS